MSFLLKEQVIAESYPDGKPVPNDQRIIQDLYTLRAMYTSRWEANDGNLHRVYMNGCLRAIGEAIYYATHPKA